MTSGWNAVRAPGSTLRAVACAALSFVALTAAPSSPAWARGAAPSARPAPACFEQWWRRQLADARAHCGGADALFPLRQVVDMARTAADPDAVRSELDAIRAARDTHPLVAAEIDAVLLGEDLDRDDYAAAATRRARLGFVTHFLIAGPFKEDGAPKDAFDDLAKAAPSGSRWRPIDTGPDANLPLEQLMTPASRSSALVVFYVHAARSTTLAFRYGADDRAALELDGATLLDLPGRHDLAFDQDAAFAQVAPGWHRAALRVVQDSGSWAVSVRVSGPEGRTLDPAEATIETPRDLAAAEQEIRGRAAPWRPAAGITLHALLEREAQRGGPAAKARLAEDLAARGMPERTSAEAPSLAREAALAAPDDVDVQWVRAVVDTDPARRREALEQVVRISPGHPGALRRLAGYHLEYGRTEASLEEAHRSLAACGQPDPYLEGWQALARDGRGFFAAALAVMSKLAEQNPRQVAVWERLAGLCQREGLSACALRANRHVLELEGGADDARGQVLALLAAAGDSDGAQHVLERAVQREPLDMRLRRSLVHFLTTQGRTEQALAAVQAALALSPDNPGLLEEQGAVRLAAGDENGAADSWKAALASNQDAGALTDRIAALTGADDSFGAEWTVSLDDARAIEAKAPLEGDPSVVVVDKVSAFRVRADGMASKFHQVVLRVRHPDQAEFARGFSFSYSPTLERATVVAAQLVRRDGAIVLAGRSDRPMLPDPEIRMWYDTRVVEMSFPRLEEGDLIDVRWRIADRGPANAVGESYFGDIWMGGEGAPVLASRLVLEGPADRPPLHRLINLPAQPTEHQELRGGESVTIVDLPPLPAYQDAPAAPPATTRLPYAVIGLIPEWTDLGLVYSRLMRDQAVADADIKALVRTVTANAATRKEKIRALYDWVIENTRYVALELGIHALKPYDAPAVFRRRFGDCKDKATLLATMLREVGVDARVALVRTRDRGPLDTTIPTLAAFDHAIVFIPGDNLWLDGTVTDHALGEVPAPDRNALALIVDPAGQEGGRLVTIPEMAPDDAFVAREENIAIDPSGGATIGVHVTARGDDAGRERMYFRNSTQPSVVLANRLRRLFPDLTVGGARFEALGLDQDEVRFSYDARLDRFARPTAEGLSAPLGLIAPELPVDPPAPDRKLPVELPSPFHRRLIAHLTGPAGFSVQELPQSALVESPWGRLVVDVRPTHRGADIEIDLIVRGGVAPVDKLAELANFVEQARHALAGRVVLGRP